MTQLRRPAPPAVEQHVEFAAAPGLAAWARAAFLEEDGPFYVDEHAHLAEAWIAWAWAFVPGRTRGRSIIGETQLAAPRGSTWSRLRDAATIAGWWRAMPDAERGADSEGPDLLITLYAPWCTAADDGSFGALVDHELCHCGQALDGYGAPRINQTTGRPQYEIRGHDVEEFVGVVRRWGARALPDVERMAAAARKRPEFSAAQIAAGCGTCRRKGAA